LVWNYFSTSNFSTLDFFPCEFVRPFFAELCVWNWPKKKEKSSMSIQKFQGRGSKIHHPSIIHPSIRHGVPVGGCFTAAALVLLQLRSDHAKAQMLGEFHEEFAVCGWKKKAEKNSRAE
jgi:hypothetical protein